MKVGREKHLWKPGLLFVTAALLLSVFVGNTAFPAGAYSQVPSSALVGRMTVCNAARTFRL